MIWHPHLYTPLKLSLEEVGVPRDSLDWRKRNPFLDKDLLWNSNFYSPLINLIFYSPLIPIFVAANTLMLCMWTTSIIDHVLMFDISLFCRWYLWNIWSSHPTYMTHKPCPKAKDGGSYFLLSAGIIKEIHIKTSLTQLLHGTPSFLCSTLDDLSNAKPF